jgi:hypothetical protein
MKKIESVKKELIELNRKFHNRLLFPEGFYEQLLNENFICKNCVLISVFPDGSNTYCGQIIRQDGAVFEFDIDLSSPEYSFWQDITDNFTHIVTSNNVLKPWLSEIVAKSLHQEYQKN